MSRRHSNVPIKHSSTGEGFALKAAAKDLRTKFERWRHQFETENAGLRGDIERLRGLIRTAEHRGCKCGPAAEESGCPWCEAQLRFNPDAEPSGDMYFPLEHDADCPAFKGPGEVR